LPAEGFADEYLLLASPGTLRVIGSSGGGPTVSVAAIGLFPDTI